MMTRPIILPVSLAGAALVLSAGFVGSVWASEGKSLRAVLDEYQHVRRDGKQSNENF